MTGGHCISNIYACYFPLHHPWWFSEIETGNLIDFLETKSMEKMTSIRSFMWAYGFIYFGKMPGKGIAGHVLSIYLILMKWPYCFPSDPTTIYWHQQGIKVLGLLHSYHQMVLPIFLYWSDFGGYVALICILPLT